jgi:flagellar biosynthesis GTPase FlhF
MMNILQIARAEFDIEPIELVAKFAPFLTPIMPASMAVAGMAQSGQNTMMGGFSIIPALASGLGMEGTGYLAAHLLIRSIRKKDLLSGILSVVFLVAYAAFAIHAMQNIENAEMFQAFVGMSVITYLGAGVFTRMKTTESEAQYEKDEAAKLQREELEKQRFQLDIEKERAELARQAAEQAERAERARLEHEEKMAALRVREVNANVRQAKIEHGAGVRPVRQNKPEQPNTPRTDAARLARVVALLRQEPQASITRICEVCEIPGRATAKDYRELASAQIEKEKAA